MGSNPVSEGEHMVKVIFYNLLRSKYNINETMVHKGSINEILDQIIKQYPQMQRKDFDTAVVFHKGKPIHKINFNHIVDDSEEIIITHFVGGG